MSDITTIWSGTHGDWAVSGTQLLSGNDLQTSVLISLFSDRVALPSDIPAGTDPRGWWADDPAYPIGSRLWLIYRAKQTQETLLRARDYAAESLQWLIDDGVVDHFDIATEWTKPGMLGISVTAYRPLGSSTQPLTMRFAWVWS